jgi:hypothetical protein
MRGNFAQYGFLVVFEQKVTSEASLKAVFWAVALIVLRFVQIELSLQNKFITVRAHSKLITNPI